MAIETGKTDKFSYQRVRAGLSSASIKFKMLTRHHMERLVIRRTEVE